MIGEDAPRCVACDGGPTVKHILIEWGDIVEIRQRHYDVKSLRQRFWEISIKEVFDCPLHYRYC